MHKMLATSEGFPIVRPSATPNAEVFRTSVRLGRHAEVVLLLLHANYPHLRATFDLDDRDRVLRVEDRRSAAPLPVSGIQRVVVSLGFAAEVMEE